MERYPTPDMGSYAGVLDRRLEALLIDGILMAVLVGVVGVGLGTAVLGDPAISAAILMFGAPVIVLAYQVGFEGYYGQTPGKLLRGIVVVNKDGSDVGWFGAVVRNVLRVVDALPVLYIVGIVSAYLTDDHQRVGDLAGNTVVVYTQD